MPSKLRQERHGRRIFREKRQYQIVPDLCRSSRSLFFTANAISIKIALLTELQTAA